MNMLLHNIRQYVTYITKFRYISSFYYSFSIINLQLLYILVNTLKNKLK